MRTVFDSWLLTRAPTVLVGRMYRLPATPNGLCGFDAGTRQPCGTPGVPKLPGLPSRRNSLWRFAYCISRNASVLSVRS